MLSEAKHPAIAQERFFASLRMTNEVMSFDERQLYNDTVRESVSLSKYLCVISPFW